MQGTQQSFNNLSAPIGVFDSGIGGLTVVKALMERLPNENIIYFGDTARVPYGDKSRETIIKFSEQIVKFLLSKNVKAIVIACNTISSVALQNIISLAKDIPVFNVITAGAKSAIDCTSNNTIAVLATSTTISTNAYAKEIFKLNENIRVISKACPFLVPLVEEGWLNNEITRLTIKEYLKPVLVENPDTIILGCTHYPLLKPLFQEEAKGINLVDSSLSTAKEVSLSFRENNLLNLKYDKHPHYKFYVSDIPINFRKVGESFLGRNMENIEIVNLDNQ